MDLETIKTKNGTYVKLPDDCITFAGDTEKEKELNKELFHTILELNLYQDTCREAIKYLQDWKQDFDTIRVDKVLELFEDIID